MYIRDKKENYLWVLDVKWMNLATGNLHGLESTLWTKTAEITIFSLFDFVKNP